MALTATLLDALVREIEGWTQSHQIRVHVANDGDGHTDFMGLTVTEHGRAGLEAILVKHWELIGAK